MGRVGMVVVVAFAGGCGGSVGSGMSAEFATAPDSSVLTPAVRKVTLTSKGGGLGGGQCSPAGVCIGAVFSYTLSLDTKQLVFAGSTFSDPTMAVPTVNDVGLTDVELQTVTTAVRAVTVSARMECGADAPDRELHVESADAAMTYGDDIYSCMMNYDHFVKVDSLNNLQAAFFAITPQS
jgi:hypothetical protein